MVTADRAPVRSSVVIGAPKDHYPVAEKLVDRAAVSLGDFGHRLEVGIECLGERFGVHLVGGFCERDYI